MTPTTYGAAAGWEPSKPRLRPLRLVVAWAIAAVSVYVAAALVAGVHMPGPAGAILVAAAIGVINAFLPPLVAALRLPFTLLAGFILVLLVDAFALVLADNLLPRYIAVDSFASALLASIVIAAITIVLQVVIGTNDDDEYTLRVVRRIARRLGAHGTAAAPGIVFLEIDGLALPVLQHAVRNGSAPTMARWMADGGYRLLEWEPDLSSQTGASQAGILLGSNDDIPAFRWVEKETGRLIACSSARDCIELERRHANGSGLLVDGGASRGTSSRGRPTR